MGGARPPPPPPGPQRACTQSNTHTPSCETAPWLHCNVAPLQYLKEKKEEGTGKQDASFRKGSSKHRGVSWKRGKWRMQIRVPGRSSQAASCHDTEEDAAHAYDIAVIHRDGR